MFTHCPFVDDKLRQLLRVEAMNVHQHILPTIIIVIPNVFILGTQAMNPNIVHTMVPIRQPSHNMLHQLYQVRLVCYLLQHTQCGIMSYPLLCL
jgi:hypothetical protein